MSCSLSAPPNVHHLVHLLAHHHGAPPNGREQSSKQSMHTAGQDGVVAMTSAGTIIEFAHATNPLLLRSTRFDRLELRSLLCGTRLALSSRPDKAVYVVM